MEKKDPAQVMYEIKQEIPNFDKNEILEYTQWVIPKLYEKVRNNIDNKAINCTKDLINKMKNESEKFKINNDIDRVVVQFADVVECEKKGNNILIKIYVSIFFNDKLLNNDDYNAEKYDENDRKYWNDIWIITYKEKNTLLRRNMYVCENCGATMKYNRWHKVFQCKYCKGEVLNKQLSKWEIIDIEVKDNN